jgi:hypothetical protein
MGEGDGHKLWCEQRLGGSQGIVRSLGRRRWQCTIGRPANQQRCRYEQHPGHGANDQHRGLPVEGAKQPSGERRYRHGTHAHAGGNERGRQVAAVLKPRRGSRHHRCIEAADRNAHQHSEGKLELEHGRRAARGDEPKAEEQASQHNDNGGEPPPRREDWNRRGRMEEALGLA